MINIQKMMQQAQQMQFKLAELQEKFKEIDVHGEAGGGIVKVTLSCSGELRAVYIDPSVISADGKDMIEDLIIAAHNAAHALKDERIKEETAKMMEELGLPKDQQLPF
jgi:DNA-binding YbaB/EbfC family protein